MIKSLLIVYCTLLITSSSIAQQAGDTIPKVDSSKIDSGKMYVTMGIESALPIGDLAASRYPAIGGSVKGAFKLSKNSFITLTASLVRFLGKPGFGDLNVFSTKAGVRFKITKPKDFYIEPEFGYSIAPVNTPDGLDNQGGSLAGINAGIFIRKKYDIALRFENSFGEQQTKVTFVGLRLAYRINTLTP